MERIFQLYWKKRFSWIASFANEIEIRRNPNVQMRRDGLTLLLFATEMVLPGSATRQRSAELRRSGYGPFDSLHLACAEQGRVDALLTTDDRFISRAREKQAHRGLGDKSDRLVEGTRLMNAVEEVDAMTDDRHLWLDGVTIEEVLAELPPV